MHRERSEQALARAVRRSAAVVHTLRLMHPTSPALCCAPPGCETVDAFASTPLTREREPPHGEALEQRALPRHPGRREAAIRTRPWSPADGSINRAAFFEARQVPALRRYRASGRDDVISRRAAALAGEARPQRPSCASRPRPPPTGRPRACAGTRRAAGRPRPKLRATTRPSLIAPGRQGDLERRGGHKRLLCRRR